MKDAGGKAGAKANDVRARAIAEWSPAPEEHLRVLRKIGKPIAEVESALRIRPDRLVRIAYGTDVEAKTSAIISLTPFRSQRWVRVPARVEFSSPSPDHRGAVISLKWQASHLNRYFPVLEADIAVLRGTGTAEVELQGTYRPPLGIAGLVFDRLVGKRIATAAAVGFVEALAVAIEAEEAA
jgi:hypothetical protein